MEYTIRTLTSKDIFPMARIITKIGVKEFKQCFESESVRKMIAGGKEKNANAIGITIALDIGGVILSNLPECEKDIYNFLASVTGLKVAEIENASMADFAEMIITLVQKEEFKDFIGVVSKLLK